MTTEAKTITKKAGRPCLRSDDLAAEVCEWLANGKGLAEFCRQGGKPSYRFFMDWLMDDADFTARYSQARQDMADTLADELIAFADKAMGATITDPESGQTKVDSGAVQAYRLAIDTRKWIMSKFYAKRYGDKAGDLTVNVAVAVSVMPEEKRARIMELRRGAMRGGRLGDVEE